VSEVRQRWRLVFARGEEARYLAHLDAVRLWERAFRRGEIPVATSEGFSPRPKLIFAAPLQLGMLAEHELADLYLAERLPAPDLRARLASGMPRGYSIVDLHDVWIGEPALAPRLAAADYRMTLLNVEQARLEQAADLLIAAENLPRERRKGAKSIPYDLRSLVLGLRVGPADPAALPPDAPVSSSAGLWMRLRHTQDRGSGRAEEVVAALAHLMGMAARVDGAENGESAPEATGSEQAPASRQAPAIESKATMVESAAAARVLEVVRPVRERLWLAGELASAEHAPAEHAPADPSAD
jgi:radical SAM-linked protein